MRNAEDYSILAWGLRSDKSQHRIGIPHRINSQGAEPQERCNPLAIDPDSFAPDPGGKLLHVSEFTYHGLDEWTHPTNHDPPDHDGAWIVHFAASVQMRCSGTTALACLHWMLASREGGMHAVAPN